MIPDAFLQLSDEQDLSQTTGTYTSTNVIDLSTTLRDLGDGYQMVLILRVDQDFASGGSATVALSYETSANSDLSSSTVLQGTGALGFAALNALGQIELPLWSNSAYNRYVGVKYTIGGATTTAGTMTAYIDVRPTNWEQKPAQTVSLFGA